MQQARHFLVAGIPVEAARSEGGGFYEVTVIQTGQKQRYNAEVFESVAKCYIPPSSFPVTDDVMDAPDGAELFIEDHKALYIRCGEQWELKLKSEVKKRKQ